MGGEPKMLVMRRMKVDFPQPEGYMARMETRSVSDGTHAVPMKIDWHWIATVCGIV